MIKSKLSRVLQSSIWIALHEYHRFGNTIYPAERKTFSSVFRSFQDSSYCEVYQDLFSIRRSGLGNVEVEKHIANITIKETVIETARAICTRRCFFSFLIWADNFYRAGFQLAKACAILSREFTEKGLEQLLHWQWVSLHSFRLAKSFQCKSTALKAIKAITQKNSI